MFFLRKRAWWDWSERGFVMAVARNAVTILLLTLALMKAQAQQAVVGDSVYNVSAAHVRFIPAVPSVAGQVPRLSYAVLSRQPPGALGFKAGMRFASPSHGFYSFDAISAHAGLAAASRAPSRRIAPSTTIGRSEGSPS